MNGYQRPRPQSTLPDLGQQLAILKRECAGMESTTCRLSYLTLLSGQLVEAEGTLAGCQVEEDGCSLARQALQEADACRKRNSKQNLSEGGPFHHDEH